MWMVLLTFIGTLKFATTSGDLTVRIVPDSLAPTVVHSKTVQNEDLELVVGGVESLQLRSVSGNVEIENTRTQAPFPQAIEVKTISGDIWFQNLLPCDVKVKTISGDVRIRGFVTGVGQEGSLHVQTVSGDVRVELPPFPVNISSVSGDIRLEIPDEAIQSPVTDTLSSFSGEITVRWDDEEIEVEADTVLTLGQRTLVVQTQSVGWKKEKEAEAQSIPNLFLFQPHPMQSAWGDVGKIPGFAVDYNRVDGVKLITHFFHFDYSKSRDNRGVFSEGDVTLSWAFGRQPAGVSSPWHRLGASAEFKIGGFVGPSKGQGVWASIVGEYWNSETSTHDLWRVPDDENTLAAFFFKRDFYDYFLMDGIGVGIRLGVKRLWTFHMGYRKYELSSLPVTQRFSVFHRQDPFRENPTVGVPATQGWELLGAWQTDHLEGGYRVYWGLDTFQIRYAVAYSRVQLDTDVGNVRSRWVLGWTNAPFPFNFRLGGAGTLPAFPDRSISTTRYVLWNTDYLLSGGVLTGILFWDFARVDGPQYLADMGIGVAINGLSLRVAKRLTEEGPPVIYLRFKERF